MLWKKIATEKKALDTLVGNYNALVEISPTDLQLKPLSVEMLDTSDAPWLHQHHGGYSARIICLEIIIHYNMYESNARLPCFPPVGVRGEKNLTSQADT